MSLLVPSPVVNQVLEYCLAWAAQQYGIHLHAATFLADQYQLVITDPCEALSDFMKEFNRTSARCLLAYYRRRHPGRQLDSLWSASESYCATLLVNGQAILKEVVTTLISPVKEGLVVDHGRWPGFCSRASDWCRLRRARRPHYYFKNTPEEINYRFVLPPHVGDGIEQIIVDVNAMTREAQRQVRADLARSRRSAMGVAAIMRASPLSAPTSGRTPLRAVPDVAAGGDARALSRALLAVKMFRALYRDAWILFKQGGHAIFPGGTLLMRKRYRFPVGKLDVSWCVLV